MSTSNEIKLEKLFIYDAASSRTWTDVYIGGIDIPERAFQKIVLIVELPRTRPEYKDFLDRIIGQAVTIFNGSKHLTPELILESVLDALNTVIPNSAPKKTSDWLESLNVFVGISDRGQVHFACLGDIRVLLAHESRITTVSDEMQAPNPLKLFSHITSGLLTPGDVLICTTKSLVDYISEEKIRKMVIENPPSHVIRKLESLLAQVPPFVTFASVLVKFTTEMDILQEREQVSEIPARVTYVTPARVTAEPSPVESRETPIRRSRQSFTEDRNERRQHYSQPILLRITRFFIKSAWAYIVLLWKSLRLLARALRFALGAIISRKKRLEYEKTILDTITSRRDQYQNQFYNLPRITRTLLIIFLLILGILMHTLLYNGQIQRITNIKNTFNETLLEAGIKRQAADNAIIYKNDAEAEKLLMEIDAMLRGIIPTDKKQEQQIANYLDDNARELSKVRHITEIAQPFLYVDLSTLNEPSYVGMAPYQEGLIVASKKSLYSVIKQQPQKISSLDADAVQLTYDDKQAYIITSSAKALVIADAKVQLTNWTPAPTNKNFDSISAYANNLYILDRAASLIFKYQGSGTTFKQGTQWNKTALTNPYAISIDSNIYLTTTNGALQKLSSGNLAAFTADAPSQGYGPQLLVRTTKAASSLYVIDKTNNRIIVIDKNGKIQKQFQSKVFTNLIDVLADEKNKILYVLNGSMIYSIALNA